MNKMTKLTNEQAEAMATQMESVSQNAASAAKDTIIKVIEEAEELADPQKIGALITAASMVYASVLAAGQKMSANERELIAGLYMSMVVPELQKLPR